jgi:hypothetical protein
MLVQFFSIEYIDFDFLYRRQDSLILYIILQSNDIALANIMEGGVCKYT